MVSFQQFYDFLLYNFDFKYIAATVADTGVLTSKNSTLFTRSNFIEASICQIQETQYLDETALDAEFYVGRTKVNVEIKAKKHMFKFSKKANMSPKLILWNSRRHDENTVVDYHDSHIHFFILIDSETGEVGIAEGGANGNSKLVVFKDKKSSKVEGCFPRDAIKTFSIHVGFENNETALTHFCRALMSNPSDLVKFMSNDIVSDISQTSDVYKFGNAISETYKRHVKLFETNEL